MTTPVVVTPGTPLACVLDASLVEARKQAIAFANATMDDAVLIQRTTGVGPLDYSTGLLTDVMVTVYAGVAQYMAMGGGHPVVIGDEQEYWDTIEICIPLGSPQVKIDDIVTITHGHDEHAVGRKFRVTAVRTGGNIPSKHLISASGVAPSRGNTL